MAPEFITEIILMLKKRVGITLSRVKAP